MFSAMSCILFCVVVTYTHVSGIHIPMQSPHKARYTGYFPDCSFLVCLFSQSPPQRQSMLYFFHHRLVFSILELYKHEIMQYVLFCVIFRSECFEIHPYCVYQQSIPDSADWSSICVFKKKKITGMYSVSVSGRVYVGL